VIDAVVLIVIVALAFDFLNGFHDAANAIATVVSTRVLSPLQALPWAAFFSSVAAFGFGLNVATMVGRVSSKPALSISGASSQASSARSVGSDHVVCGASDEFVPRADRRVRWPAPAKAGFESLIASGLTKIIVFMVLSPLLGLGIGFEMMLATAWVFRRVTPGRVDGLFRRLQLVSAAPYSLGHGTNDAQKTMGIIAILLFSTGRRLLPDMAVMLDATRLLRGSQSQETMRERRTSGWRFSTQIRIGSPTRPGSSQWASGGSERHSGRCGPLST
jgi:PiT family inorganic phosphate transporter